MILKKLLLTILRKIKENRNLEFSHSAPVTAQFICDKLYYHKLQKSDNLYHAINSNCQNMDIVR